MQVRTLLERIEPGGAEPAAALVFLSLQALALDPDELRAATRRALLLLAAGGDPRRELTLGDRAVVALADDLVVGELEARLAAALDDLGRQASGLPRVRRALDELLAEPGLAGRWLALVLLADELSEADTSDD